MQHCKMEESARRVVYQHEEIRQKARKRRMRFARKNLPADEKNSQENRDDSNPLPARNVFLEENSRKPDRDCSIKRTKNANHRNLLHFHSEIAQHKSAGVKDTHAQNHPAHFAARKLHGMLGNKNRARDERRAGKTDDPQGWTGAKAGNHANTEQPKQHGEAHGGKHGPADSAAVSADGLGVVLVRRFLSAGNNHHAHQCADDSSDSHSAQPLAGHPGKKQGQRRITGRERSHHGHFSNLKRTIERQSRRGIEASSQKTPSPGLPTGTSREVPPAAESGKENGKEKKPKQLHEQHD